MLGHADAAEVPRERPFKELGFDSIAVVELRNRLREATGEPLRSAEIYNHPTTARLAAYLRERDGAVALSGAGGGAAAEEPIAIVGMACRYPGGADRPDQLWQLLAEGRDCIGGFPADRGWDLGRLYNPDPAHPGTSYAREGGFLADPGAFDAEFFGISPREATAMDPQQRLSLELSWEALEDAGIDPRSLRGGQAGVFLGISSQDYTAGLRGGEEETEGYRLIGSATSVASGRIAYALALEGPALTVDTACSSSLVALHLAAGALRGGECSLALAGGATVLSSPGLFTEFSRQRGLAPDGRCKSFSASADGVGWAEGAGLLVLERLADAQANGHPIHAVIRGSAVNQDGASNGLTAPSGLAQERVIRRALAGAGLEPGEVDAVEAHGTGTKLGDPIEAEALLATYGQGREAPLRLGSVKSNIGHTQAAAGVAGVIKVVLAMRAGVLPRTLHLDAPSPEVEWEAGAVELLSEAEPWQRGERPRRAGVSSFGISGTNAHLILEEAPQSSAWEDEQGKGGSGASSREAAQPGPLPFALSARSQPALGDAARRLAAHLRAYPELELGDVAYSLATTRAALSERALTRASSREQLLAELGALAEGVPTGATALGTAGGGRLAYLFSGQGSQRLGMGRELHASYPVYAETFDRVCALFDAELERPLAGVVFGSGVRAARLLDNTAYAQPALFATELALYRLLESLGLEPDLLLGHSVGEIVAAHLAGVFSLADAVRLVGARGAAMAALPAGGAMLAVEATEAEALAAIEGKEALLSLAAVNSPNATVISGDAGAIEEVDSQLRAEGRKTKRLAVSHAFHSPLIEPMLEQFSAVVSSLTLGEPKLPVISNVTGEPLTPEQATDPAYWASHVRLPVRFADGVRRLRGQGAGTFLELGPDPVLSSMAAACLDGEEEELAFVSSLRQGRPEQESLLGALAAAQVGGAGLDWRAYFKDTGARAVPLPTYPFQRKRYWLARGSGSQDAGAAGQTRLDHPLLGAAIEAAGDGALTLTGRISLSSHPWLADHAVLGAVLFPGTGFLELALRAGEEVGLRGVEELTLQAPLVLSESAGVQIQVVVGEAGDDGCRELAIYSRAEERGDEGLAPDCDWTRHAAGVLHEPPLPAQPQGPWPPPGAEPVGVEFQYDRLAEAGFDYGPAFQGLTAAWRDGDDLYAEVTLPEPRHPRSGRFVSDPILLDSALHAIGLSAAGDPAGEGQVQLPFAWSEVASAGEAGSRLIARISPDGGEGVTLSLADPSGAPVLRVGSLARRPLSQQQLSEQRPRSESLFALDWEPGELGEKGIEPVMLSGTEELDALCEGDGAPPELAVCDLGQAATAEAAGPRSLLLAERALDLVQRWLADERLAESRLVFLTHDATVAGGAAVTDPAAAAAWGLVRSAQTEHPGRFALIDSDSTAASASALPRALAATAEPLLALREGRAFLPRLVRAAAGEAAPVGLDPDKTVLITGGTGGLGALFAHHLVAEHGARHVLLVSRGGENAPGGTDLAAQLEELGASVTLAACDVGDRAQLERLLSSIDLKRPLGAVIHAAGVTADATIEALDKEALRSVFAPKAEAAWHLHELTAGMELSAFVLFSSIAAIFGNPGQANYAAANAFLNGLASYRRGLGLAATSIAWGLWGAERGMGSGLAGADLARLRRSGLEALSERQGLALFDSALCSERTIAVAASLDASALHSQALAGALPPLLSGLVKASPSRGGSLAARLTDLDEAAREEHVLALVRAEVATVLGHPSPEEIDLGKAFKELGFDSLAAIELRNRLKVATGLRLAATTVFDYPSPLALTQRLLAEAGASAPARRLAVRAQASDEPIAIVGMGCRYPGGVDSPGQLWRLLTEGRDAISAFPDDRGWDLGRLYDPDPGVPRTSYARGGGFLADPGHFDADFFGVPPREAIAMDPQQRLLLETCWEALEDAGIDPSSLRGEPAGVFAGVMHHDYGGGLPPVEVEGYLAAGVAGSVASGRVAYQLGLEGPALTVDTACSSSLVTLHLAAQGLRQGECNLALAGGATVIATPGLFVEFARQRGLSPDGRCKSFSESADGVGWAEGVGMLALERLSDAEANGHTVLATIRGSAVNQDGASNGLTAPNGPSQERVIRQALANASLEPADVDAVEAHGTGTTLGDPIEAGALLATYGQDREAPLRLGSVKSNIGHTQAAAGVAGVIKTVMSMREGVLPKTLHVDAPSSKVDWEAGEIELLAEAVEWRPNGRPRRAGISSFGISGTNAHLILEEAPVAGRDPGPGASDKDQGKERVTLSGPLPLVLSAKSPEALREAASRLAAHIEERPELELTDLSFSLATTRAQMEMRAAVIGTEREQILAALAALAKGEPSSDACEATAATGRLAFLFTGQGSQRPGMGRELHATYPAYAKALDEACAEIDPHLDRPLKDLLFSEPGSKEAALLDNTTYAQPALFATELAIYRLFESFGLKADLLTGHSVGEIVAAHISGVFSLPDAAKLICARGKLMGALPQSGAMLAIEATEAEALAAIEGKELLLSLAAINSPNASVISGDEKAIEALDSRFQGEGRKTKRLSVSHAFHSPLIEPMLEPFSEVVSSLTLNEPKLPVISNLTGGALTPEQATDPAYWVRHARQPVRFADAVTALKEKGATTFLELGPDAVLSAMAAATLGEEAKAALIPTLREGREEPKAIALSLAAAHTAGAKLDWGPYFKGTGAKAVPLPTYPFQRKRYWLNAGDGSGGAEAAGQTRLEHPLLSAAIEAAGDGSLTLTGRISLSSHPWLADHAVLGSVLFPGAAFLELALRAGEEVALHGVEELTLQAPLVLSEQAGVQIQVSVGAPGDDARRELAIYSRAEERGDQGLAPDRDWIRHAAGVLYEPPPPAQPEGPWPPPGAEPLDVEFQYDRLAEAGFDYGPAFQGLTAAWRDGDDLYAEVALPEGRRPGSGRFLSDPALLDSVLHAIGLSAAGDRAGEGQVQLPFAWSEVAAVGEAGSRLIARIAPDGAGGVSLSLADPSGAPLLEVGSLARRPLSPEQLSEQRPRSESLFELEWHEVALGEGEGTLPETTVCDLAQVTTAGEAGSRSLALAERVLGLIQERLEQERLSESRLAFLTHGATSAGGAEVSDPAAAAVWGLVRSAQTEHPGRFALIDSDSTAASVSALPLALAATEEPQLALREGRALRPRLARVAADPEAPPLSLDPDKTVLITGGTGGLGALFAHHLVAEHGARHLLLVSRSGENAPGGTDLAAQLEELGTSVTLAACDVGDRTRLERLLGSIDARHPLGAVIHAAGVVEDSTIEGLGEEALRGVFAPKAEAAWHLHELTAGMELSAFVLFSSVAATLGSAGQANYAAANAFLDGLASWRRAEGLAGTSIAWGLWDAERGMGSGLAGADLARLRRSGLEALSERQGLALFDSALRAGRSLAVAARLDAAALGSQAQAGTLPAILSGLVKVPLRRTGGGSLSARLAHLEGAAREEHVLALVRAEVAAVLGHGSAEEIDLAKAFKELGFDSLAAVELRNRLKAASALPLAATTVFDYPSPAALARHLLEQAGAAAPQKRIALRAQASDEPIAIVGMGCRYPGGVESPRRLWRLLAEGGDAISAFPDDRGWDLGRLYDPDPEVPRTSYARGGGFLADPGHFDAEFFGVAPREAIAMDPQQRLLLETCWEALEDAGIDPSSLRGEPAGVFAGIMHHDYASGGAPPAEAEGYLAAGVAGSVASGRVAYQLGLEGPALTVDTACSSSLVTLHLAAQALRQGECSLALAGGATVISTPVVFVEFARQRGLSPDGRCKSFAEAADGVGWAEGVGMLALERLSDAERNGHAVLATIRGSAVNQDGASNGLTAPNGPSQERVIRQALANARLEPKDIDAVEAHGTGTTLGDPIEAGALLATYGQERETPLKLGSIKSNIGHTQAAAGVAGVIKTVMSMREGVLPKTLHVDAPSSKVDWEAGEIELLAEAVEWRPNGRPRRAGISSFGISGTNAHLILEEAPVAGRDPGPGASDKDQGKERVTLSGPLPLVLSAKSPEALREAASRLAAHIEERPELELTDLSFSLATTRAQMEMRAAVIGTEREQILAALAALAKGEPSSDACEATAATGRLAFLFTGQGSQRPGMGRELHATYPAYAKALDEACAEIDPHLDRPLKDLLFSEPGSKEAALLDNTTYAQPALFATELAIYRLFESFGLKADLLTGHSVGEIVAAHISGVFSLPDAAKLICARGKLMGALPQSGAMLAIEATEAEALAAIEGKELLLSLAAINSPNASVISGDEKAIEALDSRFQGEGRKTKRLSVSHAFHSPLIEPMLEPFGEVVSSLTLNEPKLPVISNLTGGALTPEQATDPAYWVRHARQPVRFADAVTALKEKGATTFLELGPDAVLSAMAAATLGEEAKAALIPTLREGREEPKAIALSLAAAHTAGAKLDWGPYFKGTGAKAVPLPTYPFQRKRYWLNASSGAGDLGAAGLVAAEHPLLSATIEDPEGGVTLSGRISTQTHPWLADHAVFGRVILPGTGFLELALKAAEQMGCEGVIELTLEAPLALPDGAGVQLRVEVGAADGSGEREIAIHSRLEPGPGQPGAWERHAVGVLGDVAAATSPLEPWPPPGAEEVEVEALYQQLDSHGFEYGPAFRAVSAAWRRGEEVFAEVEPDHALGSAAFGIHPVLLDAAFHAALQVTLENEGEPDKLGLPFSWTGVRVDSPGATSLRVRVEVGEKRFSLSGSDPAGSAAVVVEAAFTRELARRQLAGAGARKSLYGLEWIEAMSAAESPQRLAVLGEAIDGVAADRHPDLASLERAIGDGPAPDLVLIAPAIAAEEDADGPVAPAHDAARRALELAREWIAAPALEAARLVFLTESAIATGPEDRPRLAAAPLPGLLRSAVSEHPGRFALIDLDGSEESRRALAAALALCASEPELALRRGRPLAPRLAPKAIEAGAAAPLDPSRTVLITGGAGGLGALVARRLVSHHGARRLLLAGRRGGAATGADELKADLIELGAEQVTIAACDVSERPQLARLIDSVAAEHPLGAVIHCAGVLDDVVIASLDAPRLQRVMRPKVDAAWDLHELTADLGLSHFLLFSSAAGLLGGSSQANYAAANAFLDALAAHRQARGLPATSLAWGLWEQESGMSGALSAAELDLLKSRVRARLGFLALASVAGLELFDAALARDEALLAPVEFDRAALAARARAGSLPAVLRGLVRAPTHPPAQSGDLATRLAGCEESEREEIVLGLVRPHVAATLGHDSAGSIPPGRSFKDLGFDSLAAVELRNRLGAATGLRLPATVVFDHPSSEALARFIGDQVGSGAPRRAAPGRPRPQALEEPIAIVGMSCGFPGGVASPAQLWQLLESGGDAIAGFPTDRGWDLERLYDPDPDRAGSSYAREGGFLADAADFDAGFFEIGPREALAIDPQQRLLLEASWEALEDAGIDPRRLWGSQTGVFAGVMYHDYGVARASRGPRAT